MTREEANKLIMQACERTWNEKTCKEIFKALSQEPKMGKWEFALYNWERCSICGYADKFADKWNYCPNCGTKMENVEKSLLDIKREKAE